MSSSTTKTSLSAHRILPVTLLLAAFLLFSAEKTSAQVSEADIFVSLEDTGIEIQGRELNPGGALLRSFILPGWGQYYNNPDSFRRGQIHLGADLILISSWIYLHTNANMLENNMYSYANAYAGINLRNVGRQIEIAVGNYRSLDEYNEAQLRSRNWDRLIEPGPDNQWYWSSNSQRIEYLSIRDRMERARQQIPAVITMMVVNRVVSGINAFVQARNHNQNLPDISFGLPLESGGEGVKATLRFNF